MSPKPIKLSPVKPAGPLETMVTKAMSGIVNDGPLKPGETQLTATLSTFENTCRIKLLSENAKVPTYGSAGAACFDLYAADTVAIAPGRAGTVKTDLAFEVPEGYVLKIYSRSGHGFKNGVRLANGTGIVDSDYRGSVPVRLHNDSKEVFVVSLGDRVAQAVIEPAMRTVFEVADELSSTERGAGGFGSTGR